MSNQRKRPEAWIAKLERFAHSGALLPSDADRDELTHSIEEMITFLNHLKSTISKMPNEAERDSVSKSAEALVQFLSRSKEDPALAAMLGISEPARPKSHQAGHTKSTLDLNAITSELEKLPTDQIGPRLMRDQRMGFQELTELAKRLGVTARSTDTRSLLVERIVTVGFANRRGYQLLRGGHDEEQRTPGRGESPQ
jgi:hypothetical protein